MLNLVFFLVLILVPPLISARTDVNTTDPFIPPKGTGYWTGGSMTWSGWHLRLDRKAKDHFSFLLKVSVRSSSPLPPNL